MKNKEYPNAFPLCAQGGIISEGMSMLDIFAMAALMQCSERMTPGEIAEHCYEIADAMLAEREKRA